MKFSLFSAVAALAATALAKPMFTNSDFSGIEEGKPFKITWSNAVGPVTITVVTGPESNLVNVQTITTSGADGAYTWTPENLPSGTYALKISDSTSTNDPNFSVMFSYTGTGTLSSSSSAASTVKSTTVSSTVTSTTSSASTTASTTTSTTKTTSSTSSTTGATSKPTNNTNDSTKYKSPLALILVTVAALAYFS